MNKSKDQTIEKNYLSNFKNLVEEYEQIKRKEHPRYKYVKYFFKDKKIAHQNFSKYYNRYIQSGRQLESLKPQKRGPKYKTRRISVDCEDRIVQLRKQGLNKYEIRVTIISEKKLSVPSLTTIYNYAKKHGLNIKNKKMKEEKVRYVRKKAGELAHIDCHDLGRNILRGQSTKYYLVSVLDDKTRLAWCEVVENIQSLTVMFSTLRSFNILDKEYGLKFEEVLTDNGPEFGPRNSKSKHSHPFERMLIEMGIKHRYTRPYRPQTNGKVERFWRTLHQDLIEETDFDTLEELRDEVLQYMQYYNELRPHQALNGKTPSDVIKLEKDASK